MSYYEEFLRARDLVLGVYPEAVCKYAFDTFKIFEHGSTESLMDVVGSSSLNEPMAWITVAARIQNNFLWELEK